MGTNQESAVAALGRIGGQKVTDVLLESLARQERTAASKRKWMPWAMSALLLIPVATLLLAVFTDFDMDVNFAFYVPLFTAFAAASALGVRKGAMNTLAALKEPRAAGALALSVQEKQLRPTAAPLLKDLLPRVRQEHVDAYGSQERSGLTRLLADADPELVRVALPVVPMLASAEAREAIRKVAEEGREDLREAARDALADIDRRLAVEKDRQTLLRASSGSDIAPETLLRPATGKPDTDPQQLRKRNLRLLRQAEDE